MEVPQRIHIDAHIVEVSVGYAHMLALSADGRVYAWGRNFYGQLGVGDHKDKPSPQLISYLQEEQAVAVVAGQYHSLAVTARGDIFGWGYNREYELGVGDNMDRVLPQVRLCVRARRGPSPRDRQRSRLVDSTVDWSQLRQLITSQTVILRVDNAVV